MALHLHDNDGQTSVEGRKDQHRLPFDGTIDWRVMLKKIAQLDSRGSICLEGHERDCHLDVRRQSECRLRIPTARSFLNELLNYTRWKGQS